LEGAAVKARMRRSSLSCRGASIQPPNVSTILLSMSVGAIATLTAIGAQAAISWL
jgi:hypothetical protein